jgi:hypothetical protein
MPVVRAEALPRLVRRAFPFACERRAAAREGEEADGYEHYLCLFHSRSLTALSKRGVKAS